MNIEFSFRIAAIYNTVHEFMLYLVVILICIFVFQNCFLFLGFLHWTSSDFQWRRTWTNALWRVWLLGCKNNFINI